MADTAVTFESLLTNYRIMRRTMANQAVSFVVQKSNNGNWDDHFDNRFMSSADASRAIETEINGQLASMVVSMDQVPFEYAASFTTTTSTTTTTTTTAAPEEQPTGE